MRERPVPAVFGDLRTRLFAASERDEDRPANGLRGCLALECHFKSDEETHVVLLGSYVPRPRPSEPFVTPDPHTHQVKRQRM